MIQHRNASHLVTRLIEAQEDAEVLESDACPLLVVRELLGA